MDAEELQKRVEQLEEKVARQEQLISDLTNGDSKLIHSIYQALKRAKQRYG